MAYSLYPPTAERLVALNLAPPVFYLILARLAALEEEHSLGLPVLMEPRLLTLPLPQSNSKADSTLLQPFASAMPVSLPSSTTARSVTWVWGRLRRFQLSLFQEAHG